MLGRNPEELPRRRGKKREAKSPLEKSCLIPDTTVPPLPGASPSRQPVHSDADFQHLDHPFALVINIPLIAMTPENGSTELWLGTHSGDGVAAQEGAHGERASGRIREDRLAARRAERPPCQPGVRKGSVVVRDLRLWHAGMPNVSADDEVRVMLAMIHFAPWYRNPMRLRFSEDIRPVLEEALDRDDGGRSGLEVPVDWVSREEALAAYLDRGFGNSYDFNQKP